MFDNILEQQRIQKANELKNAGVNPYPHFLVKELSLADFKRKLAIFLILKINAMKVSLLSFLDA